MLPALRFAFVCCGALALSILVFGCGGEERNDAKETEGRGPTREETRLVTQMVTVLETVPSKVADEPNASPGRSPEDVLALQYEYINRGDFEKAYSLFAERSRREVSLARYRAFFEANAPYSVTDYSFSSVRIEGGSATVEAAFTVNSAAGEERLQRTQELVRENGDWWVVMHPEQIAAFTATGEEEDAEPASAPSEEGSLSEEPEPTPEPPPPPAAMTGGASPLPDGSCPSDAPIKGNASSKLYHVPGGQFYNKTNAEQCFATESDAQDAGFRKSRL